MVSLFIGLHRKEEYLGLGPHQIPRPIYLNHRVFIKPTPFSSKTTIDQSRKTSSAKEDFFEAESQYKVRFQGAHSFCFRPSRRDFSKHAENIVPLLQF